MMFKHPTWEHIYYIPWYAFWRARDLKRRGYVRVKWKR